MMTDFYAAYLLLCLGVIMLIVSLFFKQYSWLFYISAAGWMFSGLFFIFNAGISFFILVLGIFCTMTGVACVIMPMILQFMHDREAEKQIELNKKPYYEELQDKINSRRGSSKLHPPNYL